MSYSIPNAVTNMILTIPKLNDSNWFKWSKKMKVVFLGADIQGIASGTIPTETAAKERWDKLNMMITAYIFMAVEDDYQYLIEDLESGLDAWKKLKDHFERSTMGHRLTARKEFYEITHDSSRPISHYVKSLLAARKKLDSIGCKIDDTEFKDVLLMHLHPSYHGVRTTILAQKTEPTLDDVKSILTSSAAADIVDVKDEPQEVAFLTRGCAPKAKGGSGAVDEKGFRWCDPTNDGACHRCGHLGHIAARCMYNMPQHVKDWITSSRSHSESPSPHVNFSQEENASLVFTSTFDPDSNPNLGPLLI
jgi:hypothetical protein